MAEKLLKAQAFANLHEKRKLLRLFTAVPQMRVSRSWLFEAYAHNHLSSSSNTIDTPAPISEEYQLE